MAGALFATTQVVAALACLALALVLVVLKFDNRAYRALGALLLLQGLEITMRVLAFFAPPGSATEAYWNRMDIHFLLALAPALLYFALLHKLPTEPRARLARSAVAVTVVAAALAIQVSVLLDPCTVQCRQGDVAHWGPLGVVSAGWPLAMGLTGLVLLGRRRLVGGGEAVAGQALCLGAILHGSLLVARLAGPGSSWSDFYEANVWSSVVRITVVMALPVGLAGMALAVWQPGSQGRLLSAVAIAAALGSGTTAGVLVARGVDGWPDLIAGAWRVAIAFALTYSIVRHRVFGIDITLKHGVARGAVVAVFLALFFIVSKIVENFLGATLGYLWGGVAAGLALLILHPLQGLGGRVADALMPNVKDVAELAAKERDRLYHELALLVWEDGNVGRRERRLLGQLRTRLDLPEERAELLELRAYQKVTRAAAAG